MMNNLGHAAALVKVSSVGIRSCSSKSEVSDSPSFSFSSSQNLILSFHWIFDDVEAVEDDAASANENVVVTEVEPSMGEGSILEEEEAVVEEKKMEVGLVQ